MNYYVGRPSSPKPKTSTNVPRTSSQTNIGQKKNDDQLFEFLNSGSNPGDKKRITNQLRSTSPVETSSPKMPKLNNVATEQKKRSDMTASGTPGIITLHIPRYPHLSSTISFSFGNKTSFWFPSVIQLEYANCIATDQIINKITGPSPTYSIRPTTKPAGHFTSIQYWPKYSFSYLTAKTELHDPQLSNGLQNV